MPVIAPCRRRLHSLSKGLCLASSIFTLGLISGCAPSAAREPTADRWWTCDQGGIVRGDRSVPAIALVFTGGAYGEGTNFILSTLKNQGLSAAFFLTGDFLQQPEHRAWVRRMVAEGHYVGPHSHAHPLYCAWEDRSQTLVTEAYFAADLEQNIADLRALGALPPGQPVYFIPPYEWYNADQAMWAQRMGVVLINFTSGSGSNRDWIPEGHARFVPSTQITGDILAFEQSAPDGLNGFLLLLHLGSQRADKMHDQVPRLLETLRARGYRFVRVDELLAGATCTE